MDLLPTTRESSASSKDAEDNRFEFDRDFDRILFSAPIRRLADKTQVFPMETNDSVRTRLTHSHEVSNLCRSLALQILRSASKERPFGENKNVLEIVPVIAAAVGLAHDLGNPPFGHQGERALREWFEKNHGVFKIKGEELSRAQKRDFLKWEGNAQAFRLVTRLQVSKGDCGLNLTFATLASLMKYTVPSDKTTVDGHPATKKFGYFQDDKERALHILNKVGLEPGKRHPIAYIMEACDDIAYSTIDVEDAVSKGLVSLNDVLAMLQQRKDSVSQSLFKDVSKQIEELRSGGRSVSDTNDIALQYFRSYAIAKMVVEVRQTALEVAHEIQKGTFQQNLVRASAAGEMCQSLKDFAFDNAFQSPKVTSLELKGANMLHKLMDYLWRGIIETSLSEEIGASAGLEKNIVDIAKLRDELGLPDKPTLFGKYAFNCISTNYRENFKRAVLKDPSPLSVRYQQLLLLSDMVSGMTEDFVEAKLNELQKLDDHRALASQVENRTKEKG